MVRNVCYGADCHDGFHPLLSYLEHQAIVVVYTDREISIVQRFEVERFEHE